MDKRKDRHNDEWTDRWVGGRVGGQIDGWMDEWINCSILTLMNYSVYSRCLNIRDEGVCSDAGSDSLEIVGKLSQVVVMDQVILSAI